MKLSTLVKNNIIILALIAPMTGHASFTFTGLDWEYDNTNVLHITADAPGGVNILNGESFTFTDANASGFVTGGDPVVTLTSTPNLFIQFLTISVTGDNVTTVDFSIIGDVNVLLAGTIPDVLDFDFDEDRLAVSFQINPGFNPADSPVVNSVIYGTSLPSAVPVPAAGYLFMTALAGLISRKRFAK